MESSPEDIERSGPVAVLDILGFKEIWNRIPPEELIKTMGEIEKKQPYTFKQISKKIGAKLKVTVISDTIIIECNGDDFEIERIIVMFLVVRWLLAILLIEKQIPIRGAVSFGKYYRNEKGNVFMGPAIFDAVDWYEQAEWIGAILTPKTTLRIHSLNKDIMKNTMKNMGLEEKIEDFFIKYPVSCKNINGEKRKIELYALNWSSSVKRHLKYLTTQECKARVKNETGDENLDAYNVILDELSKLDINSSVSDKYENTIRFAEKCLGIKKNNRLYQ